MLERILFNQFRNFPKAILHLAPLTLLIGAGASGKSQVLEGVRLLAWLARGNRLDALPEWMRQPEAPARGRVRDLPLRGSARFGLACSGTARDGELQMGLMIEADPEDAARLVYEHLKEGGGESPLTLYHAASAAGGALMIDYHAFGVSAPRSRLSGDSGEPVFVQLRDANRFPEPHGESGRRIVAATGQVRAWFDSLMCLEPDLRKMRGYASRKAGGLQSDGGNLSGVLYRLWGGERAEESLSEETRWCRTEILACLRLLPGLEQAGLGFVVTPRGEVMLTVRESSDPKREFDASALSDGVLGLLALVAALLDGPEERVVLVDGIDSWIYPAIASALLEKIWSIAGRRRLRVVLAGRNPALLDALPDAALPHAVLCHRELNKFSSRLIRLQDLSDHPGRIVQSPAAPLMTPRVLERFANIGGGARFL
ncbi:MAG: hypothetical protein HQM00_04335 [Magnetococcales bacterium]|nr:hypothetical protein [Magnetococcales bacterium]